MDPKNQDGKIPGWTLLEKNTFRFSLIFFGLTSLSCYNLLLIIFEIDESTLENMFSFLIKPISFLEGIFHLGYKSEMGSTTLTTSTAFSWLFLILIFITSIIGAVVWALLDRKRSHYRELSFWFAQYLSYYLSCVMIWYAIAKIIPVQMPFPSLNALLTPLGDFTKSGLTWMYIGSNPAYERFMGWSELTAAVLILSRTTRVAGALLMVAVLINVIALNVFYNIIVKLPSIILLLTTLFLLTPYIPKLISFFCFSQQVSLAGDQFKFTRQRKYYFTYLFLFFPALVTFNGIKSAAQKNKELLALRKEQRLYDVTTFVIGNDTVPPLLTDTLRWKRFLISGYRQNKVLIYGMNNKYVAYNYVFDSLNHGLTLITTKDSSKTFFLNYSMPQQNKMILSGNWKGMAIKIELNKLDTDSFLLVKDKIQWIDR